MPKIVRQDDLEILQGDHEAPTEVAYRPVTPEIAARYALYAMASSNAYHQAPPKKWFFPLALLGWRTVTPEGAPIPLNSHGRPSQPSHASSNEDLAYDIFENDQNETVFAFRGTDNPIDYLTGNAAIGWSRQYREARSAFVAYARRSRHRRITLTGHSLGGGLALSTSVRKDVLTAVFGDDGNGREGFPAFVFNTSPRIFDGLFDRHTSATRVSIYQKGEILERIRAGWNEKFLTIVPAGNIYRSAFDYANPSTGKDLADNSHRADLLAYGLLKHASGIVPAYKGLLPEIQFK
jgi:hypothetical protein